MGKSAKLKQQRKQQLKQQRISEKPLSETLSNLCREMESCESKRVETMIALLKRSFPECLESALELQQMAIDANAEMPPELNGQYWLCLERSPYHVNGQPKPELLAIGQHIQKVGGNKAMKLVIQCVPWFDQRELDIAFYGIGGWKASD